MSHPQEQYLQKQTPQEQEMPAARPPVKVTLDGFISGILGSLALMIGKGMWDYWRTPKCPHRRYSGTRCGLPEIKQDDQGRSVCRRGHKWSPVGD
jgi:hypothetical protein